MPCCLFVSDEEIEADPEHYDCQACPVADALDALQADRANGEAWRLFRRVINRFTVDAHVAAVVLERLAADVEHQTFADLVDRFVILYDALCPPPEQARQE